MRPRQAAHRSRPGAGDEGKKRVERRNKFGRMPPTGVLKGQLSPRHVWSRLFRPLAFGQARLTVTVAARPIRAHAGAASRGFDSAVALLPYDRQIAAHTVAQFSTW